MDQVSRRILAANVKAMVGKSNARSVRQWAMDNGMDVRQMNRIAGEKHAATVDTLDLLAERIGCQPWTPTTSLCW